MTINKSENEKNGFWTGLRGFGVISLFIAGLWVAWFWIAPKLFPETDKFGNVVTPSLGVSGDMFGGLTALFSGLAFAGLISTLLMQRKELELQRKELSQTRQVFSVQRFEGTMFGLLKLLNDHVASIELTQRLDEAIKRSGRDALEDIAEDLPVHKRLDFTDGDEFTHPVATGTSQELESSEIIEEYRNQMVDVLEVYLSPYFRILHNIFLLIDTQTFVDSIEENEGMKKDYARIVRAHLSSSEVKILLFNCAVPENVKFKNRVIKYALLKHLPANDREECSTICATYPPEAFGE